MNETGQNKYSKEFSVPKGFDEVLRNLTREILRSQPEDINKFGEHLIMRPAALCCAADRLHAAYEYFTNEIQTHALGAAPNQHE